MAVERQLLSQVLSTPKTRDVTESPIVRAIILSDPANAADLVPALEVASTTEAYNARRILCLFGADAAPHVIAKSVTAGPLVRKEALEILWALLVTENAANIRSSLKQMK